jgi:UDP-glucose 4-epimerase
MVGALLDAHHKVVVLDNLSRGHQDMLLGGELVVGNFGNRQLLEKIFRTNSIDAVMHFAASSLVGESVEKPLEYYRNNVSNTIELLDAMRQNRVSNFIFSSTAAVYGEPIEIPILETHPTSITNPYGATKRSVEEMLQACFVSYGLRFVVLRYFNAAGADPFGRIGERHNPETHLIPLILQVAAGDRSDIKIFGTNYPTEDGTCVRDYVHVVDLANAHLLALETLLRGNVQNATYNLGKITGHQIPVVEAPRRPGDPAMLISSSEKARLELGWKPQFEDLEMIVKTAWAWHKQESVRSST